MFELPLGLWTSFKNAYGGMKVTDIYIWMKLIGIYMACEENMSVKNAPQVFDKMPQWTISTFSWHLWSICLTTTEVNYVEISVLKDREVNKHESLSYK